MKYSTTEGDEMVEAENSDATECSSSFDGSDLSDCHGNAESDSVSYGPVKLFKRRKLSSDWRDRVLPIMWRCKWIELQIHKLEAQYWKYVKKLDECKSISTFEDDGTKSFTFSQHNVSCEVRRKKRKRDEGTVDVQTYMLNHNMFSYFEKKRKCIREDALHVSKNTVKIENEFWDNDELVANEDENDEDVLEHTLRMINDLQLKVAEMRTRVTKVIGEEEQFFGTDNLVSQNSSSVSAPTTVYGMSMASYIASQLLSEPNQLLPERGEEVGGVNGHFTCEDDDVLIDNCPVRDELRYLEAAEQVKIHTNQRQVRPLVPKEELDSTRHLPHVAPNVQTHGIDQDRVKSSSCSTPNRANNNSKRRKRKDRARLV